MIRKKGFAPRYINFLRQICGSYERPMPNNQVGGGYACVERSVHAWEATTWLWQTSQKYRATSSCFHNNMLCQASCAAGVTTRSLMECTPLSDKP